MTSGDNNLVIFHWGHFYEVALWPYARFFAVQSGAMAQVAQ